MAYRCLQYIDRGLELQCLLPLGFHEASTPLKFGLIFSPVWGIDIRWWMQEALFGKFQGASANPGFQTPSTKACAKLPRCGFPLPRGHRIEYMEFWSLLSLKSPCLLIGGCKSRGGPCPIVHFLASFFITDLVFKRRVFFLSFQVFNSGLPFLFQGEPSLFCTSFRATESKCGQIEAAACCSNQVLNPHACLLYITISHFSLEYTIIYISQIFPNGILCQVHKFRSNRGTLCPLAKVGSDIVGLGNWHHIMGFQSVHEGLLYDPHSIRFSSRINSAVYLEACSSAHMQILSCSIKTHVAHVKFVSQTRTYGLWAYLSTAPRCEAILTTTTTTTTTTTKIKAF